MSSQLKEKKVGEEEATVWCTTEEEEAEIKKREMAILLKKTNAKHMKMTAYSLFAMEHAAAVEGRMNERQIARAWKKVPNYEKREWKDRASNVVNNNVDSVGSEGGSKKNKKKKNKNKKKKDGGRGGKQGGRGR